MKWGSMVVSVNPLLLGSYVKRKEGKKRREERAAHLGECCLEKFILSSLPFLNRFVPQHHCTNQIC